MSERTCSIDGCGKKHYARGLCHRHYSSWYYHEHHAEQKATQAAYRASRREAERQRAAAWRAANPDRVKLLNRAYRVKNVELLREKRRLYRAANRDVIRALNNRRKALQRNAPINDLTAQQWTEIKAAYRHRCAYCGCKPPLLTMDHVEPLTKGGPHTASNIVPACGPCNFRKNAGPAPMFQPLLT